MSTEVDARLLNWRFVVPGEPEGLLLLPAGTETLPGAVTPEAGCARRRAAGPVLSGGRRPGPGGVGAAPASGPRRRACWPPWPPRWRPGAGCASGSRTAGTPPRRCGPDRSRPRAPSAPSARAGLTGAEVYAALPDQRRAAFLVPLARPRGDGPHAAGPLRDLLPVRRPWGGRLPADPVGPAPGRAGHAPRPAASRAGVLPGRTEAAVIGAVRDRANMIAAEPRPSAGHGRDRHRRRLRSRRQGDAAAASARTVGRAWSPSWRDARRPSRSWWPSTQRCRPFGRPGRRRSRPSCPARSPSNASPGRLVLLSTALPGTPLRTRYYSPGHVRHPGRVAADLAVAGSWLARFQGETRSGTVTLGPDAFDASGSARPSTATAPKSGGAAGRSDLARPPVGPVRPARRHPRPGGGGARRLRAREHPAGLRTGVRSGRLGTRPGRRPAVLRPVQVRRVLRLLPGPGVPARPGRARGPSRVVAGAGPVGLHAGLDQRDRHPVRLLRLRLVPRAGALLPERAPAPIWGSRRPPRSCSSRCSWPSRSSRCSSRPTGTATGRCSACCGRRAPAGRLRSMEEVG